MSSERRLNSLEVRLDLISASNAELRESVNLLERRLSVNRVELLTLHNLVDRSLPQLLPPAAIQATGPKPSTLPAADSEHSRPQGPGPRY